MEWKLALEHLANGEKVGRPFWCSALIERNGRIEFDLPKGFDLGGEASTFEYYACDLAADDWEVRPCRHSL